MRVLVAVGLFLDRVLSPVIGVCPRSPARRSGTDDAAIATYAKAFRAPVRPAVYDTAGPPDLGTLAVEARARCLPDADGVLRWISAGWAASPTTTACSLGLQVVFSPSLATRSLAASRIESRELGVVSADDTGWERATRLAICAATTTWPWRVSNYVHLISGNHWDVATRSTLKADHPLYRLVAARVQQPHELRVTRGRCCRMETSSTCSASRTRG